MTTASSRLANLPVRLPEDFLARLKLMLPAHYDDICHSFARPLPLALRFNSHLQTLDQAAQRLGRLDIPFRQIPPFADAFIIDASYREKALNSGDYQSGYFYAQGLSSQLAVLALAPQPNEEILDLCAAPGGKTAYISCLLQNSGRIAAVEHSKARFFKLKNTIRWQQLANVQAYHKDGIKVWRKVAERFDRVLLDAPCSSEARFDINKPNSYRHWSRKKVAEMAKKQRALAFSAFHCLKPGGRLTYSTCSFAPEENEAVIDALLQRFAGKLSIEPLTLNVTNASPGLTRWQDKTFADQLRFAARVLPNEYMSAFFICNLRKHSA